MVGEAQRLGDVLGRKAGPGGDSIPGSGTSCCGVSVWSFNSPGPSLLNVKIKHHRTESTRGCVKDQITTHPNPEWPSEAPTAVPSLPPPPPSLKGAKTASHSCPGSLCDSERINEPLGICFFLCDMKKQLDWGGLGLGGRGSYRYGKVCETQVWGEVGGRLGPMTKRRRTQNALWCYRVQRGAVTYPESQSHHSHQES